MSSPRLVYQQGDHVCALYTTPEEQLRAAVDYLCGGLERGERCLYVCCEHTIGEFRAALKRAGINVRAEEKRGALVLLTKHEAHLQGGTFDPDRMISMLHAAVEDALDAGFNGLCAAGDMTWLLDEAPGSDKLAEYEARLNHFYATNRALGLCLYSRSKLTDATLDHGIATHPCIRIEGPILLRNPFYEPPEEAATRRARPRELPNKIRHFESMQAGKHSESVAKTA